MAAKAPDPSGALGKFLESAYGQLGTHWVTTLVAPGAVFWLGLLALWVDEHGRGSILHDVRARYDQFATQPQATQVLLLAAALIAISLSSVVVDALTPVVQSGLAGQWPRWLSGLRNFLITFQTVKRDLKRSRWGELAERMEDSSGHGYLLELNETAEYARLDEQLIRIPNRMNLRAPTRVGNTLSAAASRTEIKYGLDFEACWPRLWLLLPEPARNQVERARNGLESWVRLWIWGALFAVIGVPWSWWSLFGLSATFFAHLRLFGAAEEYADVVESCFDLYRPALYEALRWPLPQNARDEPSSGENVSIYLWRGLHDAEIKFIPSTGGEN